VSVTILRQHRPADDSRPQSSGYDRPMSIVRSEGVAGRHDETLRPSPLLTETVGAGSGRRPDLCFGAAQLPPGKPLGTFRDGGFVIERFEEPPDGGRERLVRLPLGARR
jgi:hypothetical protein